MEQFILGMLQEQLGKYIVGFRKEMVNASLLNGKGEITDLSLNCAAINQQLSNVLPFIELDSIHISKVAFQVSSWTNLRKAPIMVDIEHITVHISEPLHYLFPKKRRRIRQMTVGEMEEHFQEMESEAKQRKTTFSNPNRRGGYNLLDRILDNLTIEIKSIYVQFQTWGTFKTRRPGPWTPPTIQFMLRNLRYVSVDEFGQEGTPEENWAHNHKPQPRGQERTLLIFKKVSMDYDFGVRTSDGQQFSLLKGGRGVEPEPPPSPSVAPSSPKSPGTHTAAESPKAAAEVVAALAATTGPISVTRVPETAAETVAALAATTGSVEVVVLSPPPPPPPPVVEEKSDQSSPKAESEIAPTSEHSKDVVVVVVVEADEGVRGIAAAAIAGKGNNSPTETKAAAIASGDANCTPPESSPNRKLKDSQGEEALAVATSVEEAEKEDPAGTNHEPVETKHDGSINPVDDFNNKVVVQMAMKRRLRDGALLALQVDTTLSKVEVLIPAEVIPYLVHAAFGVKSCFCKDRGFEDPLRSKDDHTDHNDASVQTKDDHAKSKDSATTEGKEGAEEKEEGEEKGELNESPAKPREDESASVNGTTGANSKTAPTENIGEIVAGSSKPEDATEGTGGVQVEKDPVVGMERIDSTGNMSITGDILSVLEETVAEDGTDNDTLDGSTVSQLQQAIDEPKSFSKSISALWSKRPNVLNTPTKSTTPQATTATTPTRIAKPGKDRAIIMLPNGLVIHEKISISVSVDRAIIRGMYRSRTQAACPSEDEESPEDNSPGEEEALDSTPERHENDGYIQVDSKGAVVELIWPKADLRKGGYAQASVSHVSIQERYGKRIRTVVSGGVRHDPLTTAIEKPAQPPKEEEKDESFPLYQNRAIREDPLDLRHTYPAQAVGLKATIDCQTRKKSVPIALSDAPLPTTITTSASEDTEDSASGAASVTKLAGEQTEDLKTEAETAKREEEELLNVILVANDVGVDSFNVVMDCESWCRAVRFMLNDGGGGFDPRWRSGDWADSFTTDMLVHPNSPLELEDHLQQSKMLFLDENEFLSSDLFKVKARISNCELCIPAAIQHNVRSCDIVAKVDETLLTVSSALPRKFLSGSVGSTFCDDYSTTETGTVSFPNDPSDFSVELERGEEMVKSKSTFRLCVELGGLSTQIVPVIPFYVPTDPQQLCAPTSMTISFCFEGEPPETEDSNLIQMVLYSSILVDQIKMNCDLDLLAGAISTCLYHFQVVKETVECAKKLIPILAPIPTAMEDANSISNNDSGDDLSSTNTNRIQKSIGGRRVLVHRQFHRSRETGGLQIGFFLKVADYSFALWRQNVLMYSPVRLTDGGADAVDRQKLHFPLLKLMAVAAKRLEIGLEVAFREGDRRVVAKCSVAEARMSLCNLDRVTASNDTPVATTNEADTTSNETGTVNDETDKISDPSGKYTTMKGSEKAEAAQLLEKEDDLSMVNIFSIGCTIPLELPSRDATEKTAPPRDQSILLRCEEHFGPLRSRSFAADVGTGGVVNLHVDEIESVFLLILEALMMPTWSRGSVVPQQQRFPEKSVGALFLSLIPGSGSRFPGWIPLFYKAIVLALPEDLRLLLFRVRMGEILVSIPALKSQYFAGLSSKKCALMLSHLDVTSWYFSPDGEFHRDLLPVVAKEGATWSTCISNESPGVSLMMSSRQSFYMNHEATSQQTLLKKLVPEFGVHCDYLHTKMSTSMDNTLSFQDIEKSREFLSFLRLFAERCVAIYQHLRGRLRILRIRQLSKGERELLDNERKSKTIHPISAACADIELSVRSAKGLLVRMSQMFDDNIHDHHHILRQKDAALERLQRQLFMKERERIAAVTMASSPIAGWLCVGGTHQSGHRIATTSTLWRYWAVLRMDMLILYTGPGKYKPVDLISLRGAKLRVLAGGRSKWEMKKAFGIVECAGKTRFFVVETTDEYLGWTREIEKVTSYHHISEEEKGAVQADNDLAAHLSSDRDAESVGIEIAGKMATDSVQSDQGAVTDTSSTGKGKQLREKIVGIGSAFKSGKQDPPNATKETAGVSPVGGALEPSTASKENLDEQESTVSGQSEPKQGDDNSGTPGKSRSRLQLRGKVAGMGQATGRWGSGLLSATKQKGREVAAKARRGPNSPASKEDKLSASGHNLHVISEKEDERNWMCPQCTFINSAREGETDIFICGMCESPTEAGDVEFEVPPDEPSDAISPEVADRTESDELPIQDNLAFTDPDEGIFRKSQSSDALGGRDRLNSSDSDKALFQRTQSASSFGAYVEEDETGSIVSDLAMDDQSEAARTGGRRSRGRFSTLGSALGGSRRSSQTGQTESEKKGWFSRLGPNVPGQDDAGSFLQRPPAPLKLKNVRVDPSTDFTHEESPPLVNFPLRKLDGKWFALVEASAASSIKKIDRIRGEIVPADGSITMPQADEIESASGEPDTASAERKTLLGSPKEIYFRIQIFHTAASEDVKQPRGEVFRRFSDIYAFHEIVSECIVNLVHHPLFHERSYERTSTGEMSSGLMNVLGISPLNSVRLSGAFLAGILDTTASTSSVEVPPSHSADVVMEFLNSSLECPLPGSALLSLSDLLGISMSSHEVWSAPDELEAETAEPGEEIEATDKTIEQQEAEEKWPTTKVEKTDEWIEQQGTDEEKSNSILDLSAKCVTELTGAEQSGKLAIDLAAVAAPSYEATTTGFFEPLLPTHVTEHLQEAMHAALMKVMTERDEAHAQLVSASVLHAHTLEQERKKAERIEEKLELANKLQQQQRKGGPLFGIDKDKQKKEQAEKEEREKLAKRQKEMQQNSDIEVLALCRQLSAEISSRTNAALEVIRLKESRTIEREHETEEKDAIKSELIRVKDMLALEKQRSQEAEHEAKKWKQYYEKVAAEEKNGKDNGAS